MRILTEYPAPAPPHTLVPLCNFDHRHVWLPLGLLLFVLSPATAQPQYMAPPPPQDPFARLRFDRTMAVVLVILVLVFFLLGFVSIYTRQCAERRIRGRFDLAVPIIGGSVCRPTRGLDPETIDTFPDFVYSEVKGIKIGRVTLECAVCLNEFADDETLRLIPKCSHVFHRDCIDVWLVNHSTCPVCRANLLPKPDDVSSSEAIAISEPDDFGTASPEPVGNHNRNAVSQADECNRVVAESPRVNLDETLNPPVRSMSTRFGFARLFPRSYSMGHSLVRPDEDCERFTLRLPEEVQNRLVNSVSLSRTTSWGETLQSGRMGYRTRSVGRSSLQYERFDVESRSNRKGFTCNPSFLGSAGSMRSSKDANKAAVVVDQVDVGERSSDRLFYKD